MKSLMFISYLAALTYATPLVPPGVAPLLGSGYLLVLYYWRRPRAVGSSNYPVGTLPRLNRRHYMT